MQLGTIILPYITLCCPPAEMACTVLYLPPRFCMSILRILPFIFRKNNSIIRSPSWPESLKILKHEVLFYFKLYFLSPPPSPPLFSTLCLVIVSNEVFLQFNKK
jgi:hypothetical protein